MGRPPLSLRTKRWNRATSKTANATASGDVHASPEEGVELTRAFFRISRREVRAAIIELAKQLSRER
jgi:hypothetical protein